NLQLWDLGSGRCTLTLRSRSDRDARGQFTCLALGVDGRTALSGRSDGSLRLWQLPGEETRVNSFQPSRPWSHSGLSDLATRVQQLRRGARAALASGRFSDAHRQLAEARAL